MIAFNLPVMRAPRVAASFGMSLETCMSPQGARPGSRATSSALRVARGALTGAALMSSAGRNVDHVPQTIPPLTRTTWPLTHSPSSPTRKATTRAVSSTVPSRSKGASRRCGRPTRCGARSANGKCGIVSQDVIERILRQLGLWQEGVRVHRGTDPPGETTLDPWLDDPFPDYETEPVMPETSGSA